MYNTGNPVPSSALEDMADNAQTFDALVTKTEGTTTDRLGRTRRVFQQILMDMGFQPLAGSFQTGATITARNQCLQDTSTGTFYSWNGALPKIVPAGSTPATAGGVGVGLWSDKTDLMLRSEINIVVKRFSCVSDMVADTSLYVGQIVETVGYYSDWVATSDKPKGGNKYEIVATATGTADGGSFITLSNGLQAKGLFVGGTDVCQFGAKGDGITDDTVSIQSAIDFCTTTKSVTYIPTSTYLVTNTLYMKNGSQVIGDTTYQYTNWGSIDPKGSKINFNPTSLKSLFEFNSTPTGTFRFHNAIGNLHIDGNNIDAAGNSLYAINIDSVIYANFFNIGIGKTFRTGIYCSNTINNRFENIYTTGHISCVEYSSTQSTTDVWEQCTFWGSPKGIHIRAGVNIRFNSCLFEQLLEVGMEIDGTSLGIEVTNCYSEAISYLSETGVMFKVGFNGLRYTNKQLTITGGQYYGNQFLSTYGIFLSTDYCYGVSLIGVDTTGWLHVINTTSNTLDRMISVLNHSGTLWGSFYSGASNKLSGMVPISTTTASSGANLVAESSTVGKIITTGDGNLGQSISIAIGGTYTFTLNKPKNVGLFSILSERNSNASANTRAIYFISNRYGSAPQITQIGTNHLGANGASSSFTLSAGVNASSFQTITVTNTSDDVLLVSANYSGL